MALPRRTRYLGMALFIVSQKVVCSIRSNWSRRWPIGTFGLCTTDFNSRSTSIRNYTSIEIPCEKGRSSRR
jgi:hypothetical protein